MPCIIYCKVYFNCPVIDTFYYFLTLVSASVVLVKDAIMTYQGTYIPTLQQTYSHVISTTFQLKIHLPYLFFKNAIGSIIVQINKIFFFTEE